MRVLKGLDSAWPSFKCFQCILSVPGCNCSSTLDLPCMGEVSLCAWDSSNTSLGDSHSGVRQRQWGVYIFQGRFVSRCEVNSFPSDALTLSISTCRNASWWLVDSKYFKRANMAQNPASFRATPSLTVTDVPKRRACRCPSFRTHYHLLRSEFLESFVFLNAVLAASNLLTYVCRSRGLWLNATYPRMSFTTVEHLTMIAVRV